MEKIIFTPCSLEDWPTVQNIARSTFVETYQSENEDANFQKYIAKAFTAEKMQTELQHPNSYFFIAKNDGKNIGYLKLNELDAQTDKMGDDALEIERIYVKKEFHGLGIGRKMIQLSENVAHEKNKKFVWLGVWTKNPKAIAFYKKMGFVVFGTHMFTIGDEDQEDFLFKKTI